jgi:hypothetical protein
MRRMRHSERSLECTFSTTAFTAQPVDHFQESESLDARLFWMRNKALEGQAGPRWASSLDPEDKRDLIESEEFGNRDSERAGKLIQSFQTKVLFPVLDTLIVLVVKAETRHRFLGEPFA